MMKDCKGGKMSQMTILIYYLFVLRNTNDSIYVRNAPAPIVFINNGNVSNMLKFVNVFLCENI